MRRRGGRAALIALGVVLTLATVASVATAVSARREARLALQRVDVFRQRVDADEAFIDGDRERALMIYAGLAEATGDSSLLRQRAAYDAAERDGSSTTATSERDYARLAARLARAEGLLAEARVEEGGTPVERDDAIRELEALVDRQRAEVRRLRAELEQRRERVMLRFRSEKKRDDVVYVGEVRDGRANGYGVGVWSTGSTYDGDWENNLRHGHGVFRWKDGETYDGELLRDMRTGRGTYVFKSGERWEGQWLDDMRHAKGCSSMTRDACACAAAGRRTSWSRSSRRAEGVGPQPGVSPFGNAALTVPFAPHSLQACDPVPSCGASSLVARSS